MNCYLKNYKFLNYFAKKLAQTEINVYSKIDMFVIVH